MLGKNNQFLHKYFTKDGKPNEIFKEFIPLSAGAEAKAKGKFSQGTIDVLACERAVEKSGMISFRQLILDHLTRYSGPAHLREIVIQMHGILKNIKMHMANRMQAEAVPLEDAEQRKREAKELVRKLTEKNKALLEDLEYLGKATILSGFEKVREGDLLKLLQRDVLPLINKLDVTKDSERDKIEQEIKRVRDQWLQSPGEGFIDTWSRAWSEYQNQTIMFLHDRLSEAVKEAAISYPMIIQDDNTSIDWEGTGFNPKDTLELVGVAFQISAGITTIGGGVLAGSVVIGGTAVALGPIGLFLLATGVLGLGLAMFKKTVDTKILRKRLTDYLPKYDEQVVAQLRRRAQDDLEKHKGGIINIVRQLIAVQQDQITTLENRLRTGDLKTHQEKIELLRKLEDEASTIEKLSPISI